MGKHIRNLGLVVLAGWAVMLLLIEYHDLERFTQMPALATAGMAMVVGGVVLQVLGRAGRAVARTRCVRCRQPIAAGDVYCPEHFHQAIDRIKDEQAANR